MYFGRLITLVLLSIWSAELVRADAVKSINDALEVIPFSKRTLPNLVKVAEDYLATKSESLSNRLMGSNTVHLLKQFIEIGKSIQNNECTERVGKLIEGLPTKNGSGYSSWKNALVEINYGYNHACSESVKEPEKQLQATLNQNQVSKVKQLAQLSFPIITKHENFEYMRLNQAGEVKILGSATKYYDELKTDGAAKFKEALLQYFQENGEQGSLPEAFNKYVIAPCKYYTDATSRIFQPIIRREMTSLIGNDEDFNYHFYEYRLCQFFEEEKPQLLQSLQSQ